MAYFDKVAYNHEVMCKETYEKLKEKLQERDSDGNVHELFYAIEHLRDMEKRLADLERKNKEYQEFFRQLQNLMPRQSSIHDVIG